MDTAQPRWDVGLGSPPVDMALLSGPTPAAARVHVAGRCGWWMSFDGAGQAVAACRLAPQLLGIARCNGAIWAWSPDRLYRLTDSGVDLCWRLTGRPLGWHQAGDASGLLCQQEGTLTLEGA
jgi:hypothetical protein